LLDKIEADFPELKGNRRVVELMTSTWLLGAAEVRFVRCIHTALAPIVLLLFVTAITMTDPRLVQSAWPPFILAYDD